MATKIANQFPVYHPKDLFNNLQCAGYIRETEDEMDINIPVVILEKIQQFTSELFNDGVKVMKDTDKSMVIDLEYKEDKEDTDKSMIRFIGINEILSRENKVIWREYHQYYEKLVYKITINGIGPLGAIIGIIAIEEEHKNKVYGFASDGTTYCRGNDGTIKKWPNKEGSQWQKGDQFEIIFDKYCHMRLKGDKMKCDEHFDTSEDFLWRIQFGLPNKYKFFIELQDKETKITLNQVQYFKTDIQNDYN